MSTSSSESTREKRPTRSRRSFTPGLSMLAEGESMVWLTGGALVICLAMVIGLVGLVLFAGMSTFWPAPVVRVDLHDGTIYQGEVTRQEVFELTPQMLDGLPDELAAQGRKFLAGRDQATAERRLFRTGNFELTSTHFHWVSGFEIKDESQPEWALVVERTEWGRFYGEPDSFELNHLRQPGDQELELKSILDYLSSNRWRLAADEQTSLDAASEPLKQQHEELQMASVKEFLAQFDRGKDRKLLARLTPKSKPIPLAEAADQGVSQVVEVWADPAAAWDQFGQFHAEVRQRFRRRRRLEKHGLGLGNRIVEAARLAVRRVELDEQVTLLPLLREATELDASLRSLEQAGQENANTLANVEGQFAANKPLVEAARRIAKLMEVDLEEQAQKPRARREEIRQQLAATSPAAQAAVKRYFADQAAAATDRLEVEEQIDELKAENARYGLLLKTAQGTPKELALNEIVRAYPANQLGFIDKLSLYGSRWLEFLTDGPREANSEGGVFPAIWGTVAMTLIMSLVVVPFGVLAALYLREYARGGLIVTAVRIAINNLAGVPSIVFGVFGLGFFCQRLGGFVDGGPAGAYLTPWPPATWFLALGVLALAAVAAFTFSLLSLRRQGRATAAQVWGGRLAAVLWLAATATFILLIAKTPFFTGWFSASLPNPTFGKGGLLWAALTLALLTLPVVIVATEEALSAVPNSLREGSYAAGASKWQTIRRIVLPHAAPGIMTGMILAMARGAGEVAPLMMVGAVKLAPDLPVDLVPPFLHAQRSFMHLGFHIYDLGFQSQNSEAAKPMVFTTTLLLIMLIALLNLSAIALRSRLRRRFQSAQF